MLPATDEVVELMLEAPQGQIITYDLPKLCSALDITDPSRIAVETDGGRRAIVTVYPSNPLAEVRAVTREDLVMDRHGRIAVGRYHNGRPARRRLFDPASGSAQRFLLFGTTGAGKSRTLQMELAAEKINGIVSWLADLKHGQSVPEAEDNVDWFGTTPEEAMLALRSGAGVTNERMARYSAMGRTAFVLGRPDPLLHIRIEEANRLLEKGSPYREEATFLIRELGRTGRSVGVGVGLSAQASHLEELGGSDTLRAMLKEGEVTLLRWSSSMMRQLVADGLLPAGVQLMPIPKTLRPARLVSQFDDVDGDDEDDAEGTQGTAYILSGPHPTAMMRHWRVGSIEPLEGMDPEILALYGDDDPARLEEASWDAAGDAYAYRYDRDAMAAMCAAVADEQTAYTPGGGRAPQAAYGTGAPAPGPRARLLEDRITDVLQAAEGPLSADEVLDAVLADGGKPVKLGSVRNALTSLADDGDVVRAGHGLYAAPGATEDPSEDPSEDAVPG
ncbi:hypothetical protein [Actinomadura sp. 3N407]|uniref:hypothetical protein n=1 Tax=Actinomadura sp. 3N407 TaxID=3457423 RepID=UPI003FCEA814